MTIIFASKPHRRRTSTGVLTTPKRECSRSATGTLMKHTPHPQDTAQQQRTPRPSASVSKLRLFSSKTLSVHSQYTCAHFASFFRSNKKHAPFLPKFAHR